jgi:DNA-binding Lrp family transcriptional regulator
MLYKQLKIIEEVERNLSEKWTDIAKRLGLAPYTLTPLL